MSDDLDPELNRLFDAARDATEPTFEDRGRIRAALAAKLATGVLLTSTSANAAAAAGGATGTFLGKGLKLVLLTQVGPGLVAGTLLGAGASFVASAASDAVQAPKDRTVSTVQTPPDLRGPSAARQPVASVSPPADPPPDPALVPRPRPNQRAVADAPAPASSAPSAAEPAVAAFPVAKKRPESSELSDELALVSRMHESWQRGDEAGVRRAVQLHEQRFPGGTLTEEREAVKVMLACRNAEPRRAAALGSAFLARYPGSTHAARVVATCGVKR